MFATVHNMHLPQFMSLVPEPRAQAIDALSQDWQGRSMYDVHVSTISPAQQSDSEAQDHPGGRGDTHSPLVAVTTVVLTFTMSVCGPPMPLSVPPRPGHNRAIFERQVVPSARMEALMQLPSSRIFFETGL